MHYVLDKLNNIIGILYRKDICKEHSYLFYHIKTKAFKIYNSKIYNLKPIPIKYDLIVIGAGPSGIGTVYEYMKKNKKVLLIEEGRPASEYTYLNVEQWQQALNDPNNSQYYKTNIIGLQVGKGIGGGTLHFGLQYIEDTSHFPLVDLSNLRNKLGISKYDYSKNIVPDNMKKFKSFLEEQAKETNFKIDNNYIYATDENYNTRVLYSKLLNNLNLDILTYSEVEKILRHSHNESMHIDGINLHKHIFRAKNYVLACGALGTPELLLKNDLIPSGKYIFHDHIGFTLLYKKDNFNMYDDDNYILGHLQARAKNHDWQVYFSLIPGLKDILIVTFATSRKLDNTKKVHFSLDNSNNLFINNYNTLEDGTYGLYKKILLDAFIEITLELKNFGYNIDLTDELTKLPLEQLHEQMHPTSLSIYHYQSTLADKVVTPVLETDKFNDIHNFRLKGLPKNLLVADLSIYGIDFQHFGSTSAVAYACGTTLGKLLKKHNL